MDTVSLLELKDSHAAVHPVLLELASVHHPIPLAHIRVQPLLQLRPGAMHEEIPLAEEVNAGGWVSVRIHSPDGQDVHM